MTDLLFLGAGASSDFKVPTMGEMVEKYSEVLNSNPKLGELSESYNLISGMLKKDNGRYDVETVLMILQGILHESEQPFQRCLRNSLEAQIHILYDKKFLKSSKKLEMHLRDFIITECSFSMENYQKSHHLYDNIFELMAYLNPDSLSTETLGFNIYTTNYDRYLDVYLSKKFNRYNRAFNDYFNGARDESILDITVSQVNPDHDSSKEYVKIHGSIDWYRNDEDLIVKTLDVLDYYIKRRMLIYPTNEKPFYLEPWVSLTLLFRRALRKAQNWIFIGYSFNDDHLREIIREELKSNHKRNMVIIGREGSKIAKKFFEGNEKVKGFDYEFADIRNSFSEIYGWIHPKK